MISQEVVQGTVTKGCWFHLSLDLASWTCHRRSNGDCILDSDIDVFSDRLTVLPILKPLTVLHLS